MIDIEEEKVIGLRGGCEEAREDVVVHGVEARVSHQRSAKRDGSRCDPIDDAFDVLDDVEVRDTARTEYRFARVAKTETTDENIEICSAVELDGADCESALGVGDGAAHEELMLEGQLENVGNRERTLPEDEHTDRRVRVFDDFEFPHASVYYVECSMDTETRQKICQLVAGILISDDILEEKEEKFIDRLIHTFGVGESGRDVLFPLVDHDEAATQLKALPAEAQEEAMKLLIAAACIDGQVAPEEREYLKTMAGALGIANGILEKRIAHQLGDPSFTL